MLVYLSFDIPVGDLTSSWEHWSAINLL